MPWVFAMTAGVLGSVPLMGGCDVARYERSFDALQIGESWSHSSDRPDRPPRDWFYEEMYSWTSKKRSYYVIAAVDNPRVVVKIKIDDEAGSIHMEIDGGVVKELRRALPEAMHTLATTMSDGLSGGKTESEIAKRNKKSQERLPSGVVRRSWEDLNFLLLGFPFVDVFNIFEVLEVSVSGTRVDWTRFLEMAEKDELAGTVVVVRGRQRAPKDWAIRHRGGEPEQEPRVVPEPRLDG